MSKNNTKKEDWVIFYEKDGDRYYLIQIYKIGRLRFSNKRFTTFESVLEVNNVVEKISDMFKLYFPQYKLKVGLCDIEK